MTHSYPPIVERVIRNDVEGTRALLDAGEGADAIHPAGTYQMGVGGFAPQPGEWPLTVFAGRHGAAGTLALLLERGASVPAEHATSVLARIAGARPYDAAARIVATLLRSIDLRADPQATADTLVGAAAGASRPVLELLLEAGLPIGARDGAGRTATHAIIGKYVMREALDVLEWLLARGAPVDVADERGEIPLAHALRAGSFDATLLLLHAGSPGVGRLAPSSVGRLADVIVRVRAFPRRGAPPGDLFALVKERAWDLLIELGEIGMPLDAVPLVGKQPLVEILAAAPLELQLRALPLVDDLDAMLRIVASKAAEPDRGIARLSATLALGWDLNLPHDAEPYVRSTVLGAALEANAPVEALEMILACGASVDGAPGRATPAHGAAKHLSSLRWLAEKGADLDRSVPKLGTPLQVAVERGWDDAVVFLAKAGARIDVRDAKGLTPLERARERGAKQKVIEALAARAPDALCRTDTAPIAVERKERGALVSACARGDAAEALRLLAETAMGARDARGTTALVAAAAHGHLAIVEMLLERGADANEATADGIHPWAIARLLGRTAVDDRLRDAGASTMPVRLIETGGRLERYGDMIERGDVRGLAAAVAAGMDVELPLIGRPRPLERAVEAGRDDVVDLLLRAGANPDLVAERGGTCLIAAAQRGHLEIVARLLLSGVDVEALTPEGWNAAGVAEDAGHGAVVALLSPSKPRKG